MAPSSAIHGRRTPGQRSALIALPLDRAEAARHYTLSEAELASLSSASRKVLDAIDPPVCEAINPTGNRSQKLGKWVFRPAVAIIIVFVLFATIFPATAALVP